MVSNLVPNSYVKTIKDYSYVKTLELDPYLEGCPTADLNRVKGRFGGQTSISWWRGRQTKASDPRASLDQIQIMIQALNKSPW